MQEAISCGASIALAVDLNEILCYSADMKKFLLFLLIALCPISTAPTTYAESPGLNDAIAIYGNNTITLYDPDTGDTYPLAGDIARQTSYFDISSDGQKYMSLFQRYDGGLDNIYNNSPLTISDVSEGVAHDFGAAFDQTYHITMSPDATKIAYYDVDDNNVSLFDMSSAAFTRLGIKAYSDIAWSPDNHHIAYMHYDWNNPASVYPAYYDLSTGQEVALTKLPQSSIPLDWHPTGTKIVFLSGNQLLLYDTSADTVTVFNPGNTVDGNNQLVANLGRTFSWSPDGTRVSFMTHNASTGTYALHVANGLDASSTVKTYNNVDGQRLVWLPSPNARSVYRFWSSTKHHHFFTSSYSEAMNIMQNYDNSVWGYEGVAFSAGPSTTCSLSETPIYRFWSDAHSGHFFTASASERDYIISHYSSNIWRYEGQSFCSVSSSEPGAIPVYRFWSDQYQGHFYTTNQGERDYIISHYPASTWHYEGIAYYAL